MEHRDLVLSKLKSQEEQKYIIDSLENSIIITTNTQIEFVNTKFLNQFQDLIPLYNQ